MRIDNWPHYFHEAVEARRQQPFEWGRNDCVMFAAACVEAMTGESPIKDLKPWKSDKTAHKRMAEVGGFEAWLDSNYKRIEWHEAMRGDIGIMDQSAGPIIVVSVGTGWVGPSDEGLTQSPPNAVRLAWRVE